MAAHPAGEERAKAAGAGDRPIIMKDGIAVLDQAWVTEAAVVVDHQVWDLEWETCLEVDQATLITWLI